MAGFFFLQTNPAESALALMFQFTMAMATLSAHATGLINYCWKLLEHQTTLRVGYFRTSQHFLMHISCADIQTAEQLCAQQTFGETVMLLYFHTNLA